MRKLAFLLLGFALVLSTASARAAERRVALLQGDPELQRALALALAAWDVETLPLDLRLSEESDEEARARALELARDLHLEGIVWISLTAQGSRLAVFDAHTGELTLRSVPERPPFASTTAASLALSVKTALRPSVELGMEPPPPQPPPAPPPPRTAERALPGRARPSERLWVRTSVNAEWLAETKVQARWALATTLWLGARRRLGAELRLSGGAGVDIDTPELSGHYRDLSVGLGGEWRWLAAGAVSSAFGLGAGLRVATLEGALADGSAIANTRYNTSLDASFRLEVRVVGGWFVGLDASTCFFLGYQRFLVAGQPVFAPFRLSPSAGVSLGIALF
ncbi:MAG TPA: hypothetical protein VER04_05910 [Polyangiaceae bacterium]|nr:hypothetical protein [Polyangiaceae bacterium]